MVFNSSFVILLGAGASVPAGLPVIDALTKDFGRAIANEKPLSTAHKLIESIFIRTQSKFDIELELQALTELTENPSGTLQYFHGKMEEEVRNTLPVLPELKSRLKRYVRLRCQDPGDVSFLKPLLLGFAQPQSGLDIFTLNYDPTIEALCESENISYTDGFDPYWNPGAFESKNFHVRLFKIHGSVNWFLIRPGHYAKVPVRGDVQDIRFFTGEQLTEMVLYPALEKRTESGPYPFILNSFRAKLAKVGLLITIGYSFRDNNIRTLIIDQMRANPGLWLILASPHSTSRREELCREAAELKDRIIAFNADAEVSIARRRLAGVVQNLNYARQQEESARAKQASSEVLLDYDWRQCLGVYESLGHYEKIRKIGHETLLNAMLVKNSPSLETSFVRMSLHFATEDFKLGDLSDSIKWLGLFRDYIMRADDQLYEQYQRTKPDPQSLSNVGKLIENRDFNPRPRWIMQVWVDLTGLSNDIDNICNYLTSGDSVEPRRRSIVRFLRSLQELSKLTSEALRSPMDPPSADKFRAMIQQQIEEKEGGFYVRTDKLLKLVESWKE